MVIMNILEYRKKMNFNVNLVFLFFVFILYNIFEIYKLWIYGVVKGIWEIIFVYEVLF